MLTVTIPSKEFFDNATGLFHYTKEKTIVLEHSLVSLSKWESKWGSHLTMVNLKLLRR